MSFLAPMVVCGLLLTLCAAVGIFPGVPGVTVELLTDAFGNVLKVFGNGRIWEGVLVIAIACGFVGGMFETFNFYYYQNMN
ncbi:hypothetical protein [Picosynechococcus sp. PCC 11901]|nr:hypothetical protein [Picosynechococcus sp. PCC 11901]